MEDQRFITGAGQYVDDINRPGQTYAVFVRSPHAHATINGIDTAAAKAAPGVVGVFTGADLAKDKIGGLICGWMIHSKDGSPMKAGAHPALAVGKVRYVGDHVAVVIAETLAQARDAAELVEVDYDPLPVAVDLSKSQDAGQPQVHDEAPGNTVYEWHLGNKDETDAAFSKAKHVTKLDLVNNRLIPNAMEPRAAIGDYDSGTGTFTLWTTSQNPHVARLVLSAFIGIAPENKLRVIAPDVGGGFGSKIFIYAEETVCAWASKKVRRPVKWTADRTEAFLADAHGRDHVTTAELAVDGDGRILALRAKTKANLGAYLSTFSSSVPTYLYAPLLSGQYNIPAIYCEVDGVYTNTAPVDAYRGAGRPEATYVVERLVEVTARQLGLEIDRARHLLAGKVLAAEGDQLLGHRRRRMLVGHELDDRLHLLAQVGVRHAKHRRIGDLGMGDQQILGLLRIDVHATRDDHEGRAVSQVEIAVGIDIAHVADRAHRAVLRARLGGLARIVEVFERRRRLEP